MTQSSPGGQKPKWSSGKKIFVWGLVLAGGAFVLWKPALYFLVWASGGFSMTKAVDNRPLGYFYRFQANFSHKGEALNFDYVVACNIRVTAYRGGGRSDDSTYTPKVMMMPTRDDGAIMVRTINACNGQTTANGEVPEDLFPMAIWFANYGDSALNSDRRCIAALVRRHGVHCHNRRNFVQDACRRGR